MFEKVVRHQKYNTGLKFVVPIRGHSSRYYEVRPSRLYGEDCPNNELTEKQKHDIWYRASGNESYLSLALEYGISPSTVRELVK